METMNPQTRIFIREHLKEDTVALAFKSASFPEVDFPLALRQIAGYQSIAHKIPSWHACEDLLFPLGHLGLEQCSSEATALYKRDWLASFLQGKRQKGLDLTGGFGVDAAFLSELFEQYVYVEQQTGLCETAAHNFPVLGKSGISVCQADAETFLRQSSDVWDFLYIDPARRNSKGQKVAALKDCSPDVVKMRPLLKEKSSCLMLKLSPMLDVTSALQHFPECAQIGILALDNECKELILLVDWEKDIRQPIEIRAVNLRRNAPAQAFFFSKEEEQSAACEYTTEPLRYLYESNVAILKAGAYSCPAERFHLKKFHPNSHLYTSDIFHPDFPGRIFETEAFSPVNKKSAASLLNGISQVNVCIRNFPETAAGIRRKFRWTEGGDVFVFVTTVYDNTRKLIRCRRSEENSQ